MIVAEGNTSWYGLIEYQYLFSSFGEYKRKKDLIINKFISLRLDKKLIYKMFVYSRPLLTNNQKDIVWKDLCRRSELFETKEEYRRKRVLISKLFSNWDKKQIVLYRNYIYSKDIRDDIKENIWLEINKYNNDFYKK